MNQGTFYAVGVGCGDPLDMTLHAKQILETVDVIVLPVTKVGEPSYAYRIAQQAADLHRAEKIEVYFPMKAAGDYRTHLRCGALDTVTRCLDIGKSAAMITLGDVSVYSTATYVRQVLEEQGYQTEVVAGVPSFCSGAARLRYSLCENGESLLVMSGVISAEKVEQALQQFDNLVLMKAGGALPWLIPLLERCGLLSHTVMFRNLGMPEEYIGTPCLENSTYLTTLLIKKGGLR